MNDKDLSKPVAWTDQEEIDDVARGLDGFMFNGGSMEGGDYPIYSREYVQSLLGRIAKLEGARDTLIYAIANGSGRSVRDVIAERVRQVEKEGWTPEHDDEHANGELSFAAISYLMAVVNPNASHGWWPWDVKSWNPSSDFRHNLVRAGALIIAEIDRLDRANGSTVQGDDGE